jgi:hypothetical protein
MVTIVLPSVERLRVGQSQLGLVSKIGQWVHCVACHRASARKRDGDGASMSVAHSLSFLSSHKHSHVSFSFAACVLSASARKSPRTDALFSAPTFIFRSSSWRKRSTRGDAVDISFMKGVLLRLQHSWVSVFQAHQTETRSYGNDSQRELHDRHENLATQQRNPLEFFSMARSTPD